MRIYINGFRTNGFRIPWLLALVSHNYKFQALKEGSEIDANEFIDGTRFVNLFNKKLTLFQEDKV